MEDVVRKQGKFWKIHFVLTMLFLLLMGMQLMQPICAEDEISGDILPESLSLSFRDLMPAGLKTEHKCQREIPVIFFQTVKQQPIRGNGSTIYFHRIEVCCEGYRRYEYDWNRCVADCNAVSPNNCRNGFCRTPQYCECFEEFVRNERGECIHTCPISCENGRCFLNGTCDCNPGYTLDPVTRKYCRPYCSKPCGNHQECSKPGKCACKEGYRMTTGFGCQPVCTPDCGYGKCIGPNRCECFAGYMKRPQRNVCEAECYINCENGFCESRYKCQCRDGYKYDSNTTSCLPDCGDECENGVCVAPGVCRCFEGYGLVGSACRPICPLGCGYYGNCIEPNVCGCGVADQHCINGNCDARGKCICGSSLTRFVDKCVNPMKLQTLVDTYAQRDYYNDHLKVEYNGLIGRLFQYVR